MLRGIFLSITSIGLYQNKVNLSLNFTQGLACSAGVFWVSKTLFMFVLLEAIFDFMTVEDWGEFT